MSTGFEVKLQWPTIRDITGNATYHEADLPVGIPETHEVRGQAWVVNEDYLYAFTVTVELWLQDPMGEIRGYRQETFTLQPGDWQLMQAEHVVLDLPGRWRLQGRYMYAMWDWTRSWDAIDCLTIGHTLTLTSQTGGSIRAFISGQDITVGPGQSTTIYDIARGSPVSLQAVPESGYGFTQWSGSPINGETSTMVQFEMMGDYSITASFQQQQIEPGALYGTVVDYQTGEPISGAAISSGIYKDTADTHGLYEITGIPPGQYVFSYAAYGYGTEERDVLIRSGTRLKLDVALKEVTNGNGTPPNGDEETDDTLKYVLIGGGVILGAVIVRQLVRGTKR